jgi:hypothetical protein
MNEFFPMINMIWKEIIFKQNQRGGENKSAATMHTPLQWDAADTSEITINAPLI